MRPTPEQLLDIIRQSFRQTRDARASLFCGDTHPSDIAIEEYARNASQVLVFQLDDEDTDPGLPALTSAERTAVEAFVRNLRAGTAPLQRAEVRFSFGHNDVDVEAANMPCGSQPHPVDGAGGHVPAPSTGGTTRTTLNDVLMSSTVRGQYVPFDVVDDARDIAQQPAIDLDADLPRPQPETRTCQHCDGNGYVRMPKPTGNGPTTTTTSLADMVDVVRRGLDLSSCERCGCEVAPDESWCFHCRPFAFDLGGEG
jgi:hypothetical protein